tara:strand:- start:736 stop:1563 length:828 start_codon:yes stop_codon:yes gene_type:complete
MKVFGPELLTAYFLYSKMNQILPMNIGLMVNSIQVRMADIQATRTQVMNQMLQIKGLKAAQIAEMEKIGITQTHTIAIWAQVGALVAQKLALFGMIYLTQKLGADSAKAAFGIGAVAGAVMGLAVALQTGMITAQTGGWGFVGAAAAGALAMGTFNALMYKTMNQPPAAFDATSYDFEPDVGMAETVAVGRARGGPVYPRMQGGGPVGERTYMVGEEGPELFVPNSAGNIIPNNELGGIVINIAGDVFDGENFAEKVGEALPEAIRGGRTRGILL